MDGIDRVSMAKDGKAFIFFGDSSLLTLYALLAQLDDYNNALTVADYQHWSYDAVYPATNYLYRKLRNLKQRYGVK